MCADDSFVGNEGQDRATPIQPRVQNATVCDERDDWYVLPVPGGQDLLVIARWLEERGPIERAPSDFGLELWHGDVLLDRSDCSLYGEHVSARRVPEDRALHIHVAGVPGVWASYQLSIDAGDLCIDDALEPPCGNDRRPLAVPLGLGRTEDLLVCLPHTGRSTTDLYLVQWEEDVDVEIVVEWDPAQGELGVDLGRLPRLIEREPGRVVLIRLHPDYSPWPLEVTAPDGDRKAIRYSVSITPTE